MRSIVSATVAWLVIVSLAAAGPGAAQSSETNGILYLGPETIMTEFPHDGCGAIPHHQMSDLVEPLEPSAQLAAGVSLVLASCGAIFEYNVTQPFALKGGATAHFWMGCDVQSVDGGLGLIGTFGYEILKNGEITHGDTHFGDAAMGECAAGDVVEVLEEGIPTGDAEFAEGDVLGINIIAFAGPSWSDVVDNLYFLVASLEHPSSLQAPGLPMGVLGSGPAEEPDPTAPALVEESLEPGTQANVSLSFQNATDATYRYSWEASLNGSAVVRVDPTLSNGSATLTIRDGASTEVFRATVDAESRAALVRDVDDVLAGPWTIEILTTGAEGGLDLAVGPNSASPANGEPEPGESSPTTEPDGNDSAGQENVALDEGSARAPGLIGALLGLAGAGIVFSRGRRRSD